MQKTIVIIIGLVCIAGCATPVHEATRSQKAIPLTTTTLTANPTTT